jgi:S-formylglutathione hydrolase FrmB
MRETETAIAGSTSTPYPSIVHRAMLVGLLCIFCFGCHSSRQSETVLHVSTDAAVTVLDVHFQSAEIDCVFWYRIIIPKAAPTERLPVLYLLHGANSGPVEIIEKSEVAKLSSTSHLIAVIPNAEFSYYTNATYKRHARWENAVTQELPHDVETRFSVHRGREHTGVAGISMGGYGAVKLALKHPALYGFVGTMSGARWILHDGPPACAGGGRRGGYGPFSACVGIADATKMSLICSTAKQRSRVRLGLSPAGGMTLCSL